MRKSLLLLLCFGISLSASPVSFQVNVDTSSIAGTTGNVEFQYNPGGGVTDPSFVTIDLFTPGGQLNGVRQITGAVTGLLPGSLRIDNTTAFNDYFEGFTFTSALGFLVTFDGPPPSGTAVSGSSFAFSMFAADQVTPLLATFPDTGAYAIGDVNTSGVVSFGAPEPGTFSLIGLGFTAVIFRLLTRSYDRKA
jgi:hypothetical protein